MTDAFDVAGGDVRRAISGAVGPTHRPLTPKGLARLAQIKAGI